MQDQDNQEIFIFIMGSAVLTDLSVQHIGEFNISPLMLNMNITNTGGLPSSQQNLTTVKN